MTLSPHGRSPFQGISEGEEGEAGAVGRGVRVVGGEDGEPEEAPESAGAQPAEDGAGAHLPRLVGQSPCVLCFCLSVELYQDIKMTFFLWSKISARLSLAWSQQRGRT